MKKQLLKSLLFLFVVVSFAKFSPAQNLVPNFSFEQYSSCPTTEDQAQYSVGWSKYSNSTPDYYNACSADSTYGIPQSFYFYQQDHRNCGAYMGLITWVSSIVDYREHVGIQLNQPLVIGQKYFFSFYTVMQGANLNGDYFNAPSNNIGLRLSTIAYDSSNPVQIDNFSHLRSVSVISDTANWVHVSGSIVADSAYKYVILGSFYDDVNTDTITQTCGTCQNIYSYYLIDDVCISTDSVLCNGGIDILPCTVSVEENSFDNQINIYPNPANNYINITNENYLTPLNISIYNILGQQLFYKQNIQTDNLQIDLSNYSSGLLFIKIESTYQQYTYKLLKR